MYGDKKLEEWARVKDYNIVDGDKMEMWRVACYDRECAMSGGSYLTAADYVELLNFTSWGWLPALELAVKAWVDEAVRIDLDISTKQKWTCMLQFAIGTWAEMKLI